MRRGEVWLIVKLLGVLPDPEMKDIGGALALVLRIGS